MVTLEPEQFGSDASAGRHAAAAAVRAAGLRARPRRVSLPDPDGRATFCNAARRREAAAVELSARRDRGRPGRAGAAASGRRRCAHGLAAARSPLAGRVLAQRDAGRPRSPRQLAGALSARRTARWRARALRGLYPVGEGAGYAGGIVSAALDGLRAAKAIIRRYAPLERAGEPSRRDRRLRRD